MMLNLGLIAYQYEHTNADIARIVYVASATACTVLGGPPKRIRRSHFRDRVQPGECA